MMRRIGSMNKLSMDVVLNDLRRRERAVRNAALQARLAAARASGRTFRQRSLRGLNAEERARSANFA